MGVAENAQRILRSLLRLSPGLIQGKPERILALDVAYRRLGRSEYGYGVALLYDVLESRILDCRVAVREVCIPYIPGLLAFREMYLLVPAAMGILRGNPADLLLVDGHGISHPRGLGIASHAGVAFGLPSIGVAKKRLVGREELIGDTVYLVYEGRRVAVKLETPSGSWVYVSPGHMVSLEEAADIVRGLFRGRHRLPEPLRLADLMTKASKTLVKPSKELTVARCPRTIL